jgi:hypothetical protein
MKSAVVRLPNPDVVELLVDQVLVPLVVEFTADTKASLP